MRYRRFALAAAGLAAMCGPAWADAAPPEAQWDFGAEWVAAVGAFDDDRLAEPFVARGEGWLTGSLLFDNQVELGVSLGLVAERDNPRADPRGDVVGDCPASFAACPSIAGAPVRSVWSRGAAAGSPPNRSVRAQLETAFVYASAPFGEVSLGRQEGTASRFDVGAASGALAAADPRLDMTGLGAPRTKDTTSGPSAKLSATTARVLGVQLGVSYTPEIEAAGLDAPKRYGPAGSIGFEPGSVWEAGLSFALRPPGWAQVNAGLAVSKAESDRRERAFEDMSTVTASFSVAEEGWSLGLAALVSDQGWAPGGGDYRAVSARAGIDVAEWTLGLEMATSSDDLVRVDLKSALVSAARPMGDGATLRLGLQGVERDSPTVGAGGAREARRNRNSGAFLEWSWRL